MYSKGLRPHLQAVPLHRRGDPVAASPIGYESRRACGYFYAFCIVYKLNYNYFEEILQQHLQLRGLFYTGLSIKASYTRASLLGHQGDSLVTSPIG